MEKLSDDHIRQFLTTMEAWEYQEGSILCSYGFDAYPDAVGFAVRVALLAERKNHHPVITLEYGSVTVELTTHEAQGVSAKDIDFAHAVDQMV